MIVEDKFTEFFCFADDFCISFRCDRMGRCNKKYKGQKMVKPSILHFFGFSQNMGNC